MGVLARLRRPDRRVVLLRSREVPRLPQQQSPVRVVVLAALIPLDCLREVADRLGSIVEPSVGDAAVEERQSVGLVDAAARVEVRGGGEEVVLGGVRETANEVRNIEGAGLKERREREREKMRRDKYSRRGRERESWKE